LDARREHNHRIVVAGDVSPACNYTMSDSNELKPTSPAGTPVPDLIEQYRVRRDAWIAQADELARLRDEVRGSAEREAMEIVTAARRDVRQIVMEARRELLVLSAQVQAALGEANARPDPSGLLKSVRDTDVDGDDAPTLSEALFAPEEAVKGMLDEARADMDALVADARTVPFQAFTESAPTLLPSAEAPVRFSHEPLLAPPSPELPMAPTVSSTSSMSPTTSRVLLSSPFPSDSVPVPSNRRARLFVLFGAAGVVVLLGTIWWMRSGNDAVASEPAAPSTASASAPAPSASTSPAAPPPVASSPPPVVADAPAPTSALSLLVEARRSSWLRTTVDGESDAGRMLAQGEKVRLNAQRNVSLRVGDAGAVFVTVNNGKAAPLGRDGQVVTRLFLAETANRAQGPIQPESSPQFEATPPPALTQRPAGASAPVASGAPNALAPTSNQLPLVQPVAAAPEPAPAAVGRAEPPPTNPLPTPAPSSPASAVIAASRQWLDAYQRQDRVAMASLSSDGLQLADERRNEERFPANVSVDRSLDKVSVQIAADTAVLTAIMTERSVDNGLPPRVSPISQVWELRGNQWRVRQVRMVSEARLNQIFR
jgi:hypothetical protein